MSSALAAAIRVCYAANGLRFEQAAAVRDMLERECVHQLADKEYEVCLSFVSVDEFDGENDTNWNVVIQIALYGPSLHVDLQRAANDFADSASRRLQDEDVPNPYGSPRTVCVLLMSSTGSTWATA